MAINETVTEYLERRVKEAVRTIDPMPNVRLTCVACPTQLEGTWQGREVYFRHRHGVWYAEIGGVTIDSGTFCYDPNADGYMPESVARGLLWEAIQNYVRSDAVEKRD